MSGDHPYAQLTPDRMLDAVASTGAIPDGRLLALNSYENRVYQVGVETGPPLVAKFYRPDRWSNEAILEEHAFALELEGHEIPVVAPLADERGATLHEYQGFRFALFPRHGGHWPELDDADTQHRIGRFLGRLHAVGAVRPFQHRHALSVENLGIQSYQYLLEQGFIPQAYTAEYRQLSEGLVARIAVGFNPSGNMRQLRIHGDFHPGNILWTDSGVHIVDLDDCCMGPAVQDLWMLLSGTPAQMGLQLSEILDGYSEFCDFDPGELRLIEPLRTLRIMHYAYWLARRWSDPAFPHNFPWFNTPRYWEEHILTLREQAASLDSPPLNAGDL